MDPLVFLDKNADKSEAMGRLSALGFVEPRRSLDNIELLAEGVEDPLLLSLIPALVEACAASADPDACLNNFERISSACESRESFFAILSGQPDCVKLLAPVAASSGFLVRFVIGGPEEILGWLFTAGRLEKLREREGYVKECLAACPPDTPVKEAMARLRRFKYLEFLRITVRDLLGRADLQETTIELSNLADACLEAALRVAMRELDAKYGPPQYTPPKGKARRCPFTIIAMGKLGGRDLNFSSDIDIMYVYLTDEGGTRGPQKITNHQYFVKLGELINRLIGDKTADGFVFRVDLRLRPEGERGDLVQSLGGYEIYYESWGQTWERSALIKARPCAGDHDLGRQFLERVRPFVFRKYLDYAAIAEIRDMKQRVERHASAGTAKEVDLKHGYGGIREIEFFISALQLIYGGHDPGIRERGTFRALHRLAMKNLINFEEQRDLARAYEFLRLAEHRLQLVDERQIHSFFPNTAEVQALARRMGYRDKPDALAGEAFLSDLERHTRRVREIYDGLLSEEAVDVIPASPGLGALLNEEAAEEDAAVLLAANGFRQPHRAYADFLLLRDGSPGSPLTPRTRNLFMKVLPALMEGCAEAPDPDMALSRLESFIEAFGSREAVYGFISEKPQAARQMTRLFGSSEYFSRLLISHPEMGDTLLRADREELEKTREHISVELFNQLGGAEGFADAMDILRRFKHEEEIRIGIKDVTINPGFRGISADLTALAEAVLGQALDICAEDVGRKYGAPDAAKKDNVAVIGFGKLGAGELGYGSDLDIVFIYGRTLTPGPSPTGGRGEKAKGRIDTQEFYFRLAERVIFALSSLTREGYAFRVDTRLRPGGSKGVIAHRLDSLEEYYQKKASIWELQALTRARAVAGDAALCRAFEDMRLRVLSKKRDAGELAAAIKNMRARMERELGGKAKGGIDIKYGKGGLVDVEFLIQYIQLARGHEHPGILLTDCLAALDEIKKCSLMDKKDAAFLKDAYTFMRELESRIRFASSQAETVLPNTPENLAMLAGKMGYQGKDTGEALLGDYKSHAGKTREIFNRHLS